MTTAGTAVTVGRLRRDFRSGTEAQTVIDDVSFTIPFGSVTAVLGRSGSGKSTLLNMLGLLLAPTSGQININGRDTGNLSTGQSATFRLENIGFIFQAFHLIPYKTVIENVELPLVQMAVPKMERRLRALEIIEKLGLAHRVEAYPGTLSGGEQQRVAIARAIVTRPKLLLCDEPTGNLDSQRAQEVLDILRSITGPKQATIIVTHDQEIARACDGIIEVTDGRVSMFRPQGVTAREQEQLGNRHEEPLSTTQPPRSRTDRLLHWARIGLYEAATASMSRVRRNLFTALGASLGIAALVLTVGLTTTISAQLSDRFDAFLAQRITMEDPSLALATADEVINAQYSTAMLRVAGLNGISSAGLVTDQEGGSPQTLSLIDPNIVEGAAEGQGPALAPVQAPVRAIAPEAAEALGMVLVEGRGLDRGHVQRGDSVALVGTGILNRLGHTFEPGMEIFVNGHRFQVLGTVTDENETGSVFSTVYIPLGQGVINDPGLNSTNVHMKISPGAAQQLGQEAPLAWKPEDPASLSVALPLEISSLRESVDAQGQTLLLAMSVVTMVIGAVGIMNTFLVAVMERRREIGLRMALGSSPRAIVVQFAFEATIVGVLGGVIGIFIGTNALAIISAVNHWQPVVEPLIVPIGLLAGTLVGAVAGLFPALKASRVDPVESLMQT